MHTSHPPKLPSFRIDIRGGYAIVTIDRPPVNAFSRETYSELNEVISFIEATPAIRAMVLACADDARAWIGGGDLHEFLTLTSEEARRDRHAFIEVVTDRLYHLSRPTIAAVSMPAPGGGMVLASFCDIIIAAEETFFSMPEVDRGLTGGAGSYLNRLNLPVPIIREIILTGRKFSAAELKEHGFVNYVLPKDAVLPKAIELAEIIARKSAATITAIKRGANNIDKVGWDQGRTDAHQASEQLVTGPDYKEAINAFLEKREPKFNQ
ncbi:enoyl-CoA hydratase/isomerase family protein [Silicimonas algicola]|uniref:Enoyl-CoA hydratase n=1 Tax=Silicimonas algicola TaxID=1826607 RepID=A0A316FYV6_9RHOB|nr:enoyl-CoA hydratase/isomerase family protein [Silicimonas algicola]AZQ68327.1 enoyl-CoA hydratase/isomerase family protein [Silicimonas algicola]PWK53603.1 enoyl-CoA hydratase [Silicimonas algicola]